MTKVYHDDFIVSHIVKKSLKNSHIQIEKNGDIILKTPPVSSLYIQDLLTRKSSWIKKSLAKQKPLLNYLLEEKILFLGELQSISQNEIFQKLSIMIEKKNNNFYQKYHDSFYKEQAQEYLYTLLCSYSQKMNVTFKEMKLRKMKRRWGSCSSNGIITFNTNLMKLKPIMIEYVVIHELTHLKQMNHSKMFYNELKLWMPEYKEVEKSIKDFSY